MWAILARVERTQLFLLVLVALVGLKGVVGATVQKKPKWLQLLLLRERHFTGNGRSTAFGVDEQRKLVAAVSQARRKRLHAMVTRGGDTWRLRVTVA